MRVSDKFIAVLIIILIITIWCIYDNPDGFKTIKAPDGELYPVIESNNTNKAAEILSELNKMNVSLMRWLREHHPHDPRVKLLLRRYDPNVIREHLPNVFTPETSFIQNKGEKACFCLREGTTTPNKNSPFDSMHTIKFVDLHEMAHLAESAYGHPRAFWQTFKFLITSAKEAGLYDPINYKNSPEYYCGLRVAYNPYFDNSL